MDGFMSGPITRHEIVEGFKRRGQMVHMMVRFPEHTRPLQEVNDLKQLGRSPSKRLRSEPTAEF